MSNKSNESDMHTLPVYENRSKKLLRVSELNFDLEKGISPLSYPVIRGTRICCHNHMHEALELIWVQDGELTFTVNGEIKPLRAGELLVINPFDLHSGMLPPQCNKLLYYAFNINLYLLKGIPDNKFQEKIDLLIQGKCVYANTVTDQAEKEALQKNLTRIVQLHHTGKQELLIVSEILRIFHSLHEPIPVELTSCKKSNCFIRDTLVYMQNNLKSVTLYSIAKEFSYNKSYFTILFRKNFGASFTKFCSNYKIDLARKMIESGNFNLTNVCSMSGFNNYAYFYRKFHTITGLSPSDYVKKCQTGTDKTK